MKYNDFDDSYLVRRMRYIKTDEELYEILCFIKTKREVLLIIKNEKIYHYSDLVCFLEKTSNFRLLIFVNTNSGLFSSYLETKYIRKFGVKE